MHGILLRRGEPKRLALRRTRRLRNRRSRSPKGPRSTMAAVLSGSHSARSFPTLQACRTKLVVLPSACGQHSIRGSSLHVLATFEPVDCATRTNCVALNYPIVTTAMSDHPSRPYSSANLTQFAAEDHPFGGNVKVVKHCGWKSSA